MANLPKEITRTLYITQSRNYLELISLEVYDGSEWGDVVLGTVEVTVPVPQLTEYELVSKKVEALKAKKSKIQAELNVKVNNIQQQIDELLCLEYDGK